jgi:hypothetical protein
MVEPGASSQEIREEIFETFRSKIEESDVDEDVAGTVLENALADDPPHEFSEQVAEDGS